MSQPNVLCVMPAAGRQAMVERAVRCFHQQTYQGNRALVILDNGPQPLDILAGSGVHVIRLEPEPNRKRPVGELRNLVNAVSLTPAMDAEIIAHWDSDDWSHPRRLAEQVALLQGSKAQAVGYNDLLFWCSAAIPFEKAEILPAATMWHGEAWRYSQANPRLVPGTTLCYWRSVWEKHPFPLKDAGEDTEWLLKVKAESISSIPAPDSGSVETEPRMIASIHGENTCSAVTVGAREWSRAPRWDKYCSRTMSRC